MKKQGKEWKVAPADAETRLDKWLASPDRLGSRSRALDALAKGKVFVGDVEQTTVDSSRKLQPGEAVRIWMDRPGSSERRYSERRDAGLHLIYEDAALVIINKPAGLLSVPLAAQPDEPSVLDKVKEHLRSHRKVQPLVVHRIDRDTSGLVIFAKTTDAQRNLKDQLERRAAERVYLALVHGHPAPESGIWRDHLTWDRDELKQQLAKPKPEPVKGARGPRRGKGGKESHEAVSHYRVIESFASAALVEIRLVSGKRNQIRIQAGLRGHPLVGEKMYVYENAPPVKIAHPRQALHAHRLKFVHPVTEREVNFEAPLPEDLVLLMERLRRT
ncbi:MAG: RluA family pseudouridine synthase [Blastocatellia bacterium]